MKSKEISPNVYMIKQNVENILFEGIWEIPQGTSINAYLIKDEKNVLIDGLAEWEQDEMGLVNFLADHGLKPTELDALVVNHMEPDHSAWLWPFLDIHPDIQIYATKEGAALIRAFCGEGKDIVEVKEGDTLETGSRTLEFFKIPNVHWPDTMMTYDRNSKILFSCDAFGAFGRLDQGDTDEEIDPSHMAFYERERLRYFSTVLGAFSPMVLKAADKTRGINPAVIAPGHGPIYVKNPTGVIEEHERFAKYQKGKAKPKVTVLWGSMYGMSHRVLEQVENTLKEQGLDVVSLEVSQHEASTMFMHTWESTGIVVLAPTYEYKMFPLMAAFLDKLGKKRLNGKVCLYTGSYGWSGGAFKELEEILTRNRMQWNVVGDYSYKGAPCDQDRDKLKEGLLAFAQEIKKVLEEE